MDSSVSSMPIGTALKYKPLVNSEIRLIRIDESDSPEGYVSCSMQHFELDSEPEYSALSYVWGDPNERSTIFVNGIKFDVTLSLHSALNALRFLDSQTEPDWYWIDAVCIDQGNMKEKDEQIPRMGRIYSSASGVICRIGEEIGDSKLLSLVTMHAWTRWGYDIYTVPPEKLLEEIGKVFGEDLLRFLIAFSETMQQPWFTRVWTFQEYVLGKARLGLQGNHLIVLESLCALAMCLGENVPDSPLVSAYLSNTVSLGFRLVWLIRSSFTAQEESWKLQSFAHKILQGIQWLENRQTSIPHDYIYGILGLVDPEEVPAALWPNYGIPFGQVFFEFTKYIIMNSGDLRILSTTKPKLDDCPSWVPDLRDPWLDSAIPLTTNPVEFSLGGWAISVEGVRLGLPTAYSKRKEGETAPEYLSRVEATIFTASASIRNLPLQNVVQELLTKYNEKMIRVQTPNPEFNSMSSLISHSEADRTSQQTLEVLAQRHFFLLESGEIGTYRVDPEPGEDDEIWIFKGSIRPHFVRPSNDSYELGGMSQIWTNHPKYNEAFFSQRKVERITLI